ncbi:MAG: aspartate aminotransferase family protein [Bacteroidota bacterium]
MKSIPEKGIQPDTLIKQLKEAKTSDVKWEEGQAWSLVYHIDRDHTHAMEKAAHLFFSENYLNPLAFKSLRKLEDEVVRMTINMLNGDKGAVGTMTSCGTESLLLAVYAARERSKKLKPWLRKPEVVLPESAHVGFDKAAHYFGVKLVKVPLNDDFTVNIKRMEKAISRRTILIVASAPQYPQGVMDPIEDIGLIAQRKKIPFHVDACMGGFFLPWIESAGYNLPKWDFRVPGVTSISADVHKYGYSIKGASVLSYRNMDYLKHQFFVATEWPGGIYASPTLLGSRPGIPIAAAWMSMHYMGKEGYVDMAKQLKLAAEKLIEGINDIPELEVLGDPCMSVMAYRSSTKAINIYALADQMEQKGWTVERQQRPSSIHLTVVPQNLKAIKQYLEDVRNSVEFLRQHPEAAKEGTAPVYGLMAKMPLRKMVKKNVRQFMESMYADGKIPDLK